MNTIKSFIQGLYMRLLGPGSQKFRMHKGGKWYLVRDEEGAGGMGNPIEFWTREEITEYDLFYILKIEEY